MTRCRRIIQNVPSLFKNLKEATGQKKEPSRNYTQDTGNRHAEECKQDESFLPIAERIKNEIDAINPSTNNVFNPTMPNTIPAKLKNKAAPVVFGGREGRILDFETIQILVTNQIEKVRLAITAHSIRGPFGKHVSEHLDEYKTACYSVRLKKKGKRFEIGCYKNKVMSYRTGVETDLDEVLQIEEVFSNVSKGIVAKTSDISRAFGTDDKKLVIQTILEKGTVQVSEKERVQDLERHFKDIAQIITMKCVNTETQRPFPVAMVEEAMRNIHFSVKPGKSAKQQALAAIPSLQEIIPICRSQMRLKVCVPLGKAKEVQVFLNSSQLVQEKERDEWSDFSFEMNLLLEPGNFKEFSESIRDITKGTGSVQVLDLCVIDTGEMKI